MDIYKRDDSQFWWTTFVVVTADGKRKRVRRSTKERKQREAEKVAWNMLSSYKADRGAGKEKSEELLRIVRDATDLAINGDLNAYKAQEYISELLSISTGEEIQTYSIEGWLTYWLGLKKEQVKKGTLGTYKTAVKTFLEFLGDHSQNKLQTLTKKQITDFRASLRAKGLVAKTVNLRVKSLGICLEQAKKDNITSFNVAYGITPLPETDSKSRIPFTHDEVKELINNAESQDWKGALLVASTTGLRLLDVTNLHWGQVDLVEGVITIKPRKTSRKGRTLSIPIHEHLLEFLLSHPCGEETTAPLFPSLAGRPSGGRAGLSITFATYLKKLNISQAVKVIDNEGLETEALKSFHSLRHYFVSSLANGNVSQELRKKLAGHTSDQMNDIYTTIETETLRDAVNTITIEL